MQGSEQAGTHAPGLGWLEDGTPYSTRFDDVYYSREDGRAESEYVFLRGNRLQERFAALADAPDTLFVIGETGFGTGLNFLLSWRLWLRTAPPAARLLFRSLEAFPLQAEEAWRALQRWPELQRETELLIAEWPLPVPGLHTLDFESGRVRLQLYVGDINEALAQFRDARPTPYSAVDAWFLDGFAPARNPVMWSERVIAQIAALSASRSTLATFSVAATLRAELRQSGWHWSREPGFGRKRDMLVASRNERAPERQAPSLDETPWHHVPRPAVSRREALVIGAGIAGCSSARALAERGWQVRLLDAEAHPAGGASGNPQGALFTQLSLSDTAHAEFTLHSFLFALRYYTALLPEDGQAFSRCGLLQLYGHEEQAKLDKLRMRFAHTPALVQFIEAEQAAELASVKVTRPGLYLPQSGWIDPRAACARLIDHALVEFSPGVTVSSLRLEDGRWLASGTDGREFAGAIVVIAAGPQSANLLPALGLPLSAVAGQISRLTVPACSRQPRCVVSGDGYVLPPRNGELVFGASYRRGEADCELRETEHRENLRKLAGLSDDFADAAYSAPAPGGRTAVRCVTPDRLPVVGAIPDPASLRSLYAPLRHNARALIDETPGCLSGLYLNTGHGSRGLSSAPLSAELIACHASGEPAPVPRRLSRALSPARFIVRALCKGLPT